MRTIAFRTLVATILLSAPLNIACAQSTAPKGSEATGQSSTMGPAAGNNDGASNGVGTAGSLDHDAGKASSTVAGMHGAAGVAADGSNKGAAGPKEKDPALGGGSQAPK